MITFGWAIILSILLVAPPIIPIELVQAFVIAVGNFAGILVGYYFLEKRTDRKIGRYWQKARTSPEGKDLFAIFKEVHVLLKSEKVQQLVNELGDVVVEARALLKKMKERFETQPEDTEDDGDVLPSLNT